MSIKSYFSTKKITVFNTRQAVLKEKPVSEPTYIKTESADRPIYLSATPSETPQSEESENNVAQEAHNVHVLVSYLNNDLAGNYELFSL